ncbi:hypothetical protein QPK87_17900 [Kamptonema cortianum]|nr:hypothetical protein [Kamptonema cortianum]
MKSRYFLFGLLGMLPFQGALLQAHHNFSPTCALQYVTENSAPVTPQLPVAGYIEPTPWALIVNNRHGQAAHDSLFDYQVPSVPSLRWLRTVQRTTYG